jgi:hypothetical protein
MSNINLLAMVNQSYICIICWTLGLCSEWGPLHPICRTKFEIIKYHFADRKRDFNTRLGPILSKATAEEFDSSIVRAPVPPTYLHNYEPAKQWRSVFTAILKITLRAKFARRRPLRMQPANVLAAQGQQNEALATTSRDRSLSALKNA